MSDFQEVLGALLGKKIPNLSSVARLQGELSCLELGRPVPRVVSFGVRESGRPGTLHSACNDAGRFQRSHTKASGPRDGCDLWKQKLGPNSHIGSLGQIEGAAEVAVPGKPMLHKSAGVIQKGAARPRKPGGLKLLLVLVPSRMRFQRSRPRLRGRKGRDLWKRLSA